MKVKVKAWGFTLTAPRQSLVREPRPARHAVNTPQKKITKEFPGWGREAK